MKLTLLCIISAGNYNCLTCGRNQRVHKCLLVISLIEYIAVHGKGQLSVLFIQEGQQLSQLSEKFLLIYIGHLRLKNCGLS